jgi:RNA polymerase sigma-70 factor (ECF subfamily)
MSAVGPDFQSLYAEQAPKVRRLLQSKGVPSAELEDALQETFVVVHRLLPEFEGRSSVETWVQAIAWRVASNHRRRERARAGDALDCAKLAATSASPSNEDGALHVLWDSLDPERRDLLVLHEIGGLSISELAELTGRARATIRLKIKQGRLSADPGSVLRRRAFDPCLSYGETSSALEGIEERPHLLLLPNKQVCFSSVDDVLIHVWSGEPAAEYLKSGGETMEALLALYPNGIRYLCVLEPTAKPPGREARHMNAELARRFGSKLKAVSFAVESSVLMRIAGPILNSYLVLARTSINLRFFNSLGPATKWLAQYGTTDQAALLDHVEAMRVCLDRPRQEPRLREVDRE